MTATMSNSRKTVFPTGDIAEMWAMRQGDHARNPQNNLSFNGDELRSYTTTVAKIHGPRGSFMDGDLALVSLNDYSATTRGHIRDAMFALTDAHTPHVRVPVVDPKGEADHAANLLSLLERAEEAEERAKRSRKYKGSLEADALSLRDDARAYARTFGITLGVPTTEGIRAWLDVEWGRRPLPYDTPVIAGTGATATLAAGTPYSVLADWFDDHDEPEKADTYRRHPHNRRR